MPESRHDFGAAYRIEAETFGVPGQRTFRIIVANAARVASLWMEKEQLAALGRAIETQLARLRALRADPSLRPPDDAPAHDGRPDLDFRVAQLALGFDEESGRFLLLAYTAEDEDEDRPTFGCRITPGQFRDLAQEINRIVNAGRPMCPLCGVPMDATGHACIRANGHSKQPIPPPAEEDDD